MASPPPPGCSAHASLTWRYVGFSTWPPA
jgi:hypothetical protein